MKKKEPAKKEKLESFLYVMGMDDIEKGLLMAKSDTFNRNTEAGAIAAFEQRCNSSRPNWAKLFSADGKKVLRIFELKMIFTDGKK